MPAPGIPGFWAELVSSATPKLKPPQAALVGERADPIGTTTPKLEPVKSNLSGVMAPKGNIATKIQTSAFFAAKAAEGPVDAKLRSPTAALSSTQTLTGTIASSLQRASTSLTGTHGQSGSMAATLRRAAWASTGTHTAAGPTVPTFDAAGAGQNSGSSNGVTSLSATHTAAGGAKCVAIAVLFYTRTTSTEDSAVTYGGTPMTKYAERDATSGVRFLRIFTLFNPPTGAQTVTASWSSSGTAVLGTISYVAVGSLGGPYAAASTTTTNNSVTVPSVVSTDMVFAAHAEQFTSSFSTDNHTTRATLANTATTPNIIRLSDTGTAGSVTGSVAMSCTQPSTQQWAAIGFRLIQ